MSNSLITITYLKHPYIQTTLHHPLTLSIKKGEKILLTGRNGTGKSTFLKLCAGILPLDDGQGQCSINASYSYVGPDFALKPDISVATYAQFCRTLFLSDVTLFNEKAMDALSSGQKMNLRLQHAMQPSRVIWLLDEPTRFLDEETESCFWKKIDQHCLNGGIACVSHHGSLPEKYNEKWRHISF